MTATPDTSTRKVDTPLSQEDAIASLGRYGYGWADSDVAGASAKRGLSEDVVRDISAKKNESEWMLQTRLKALDLRPQADAELGLQPRGHRLRQHQVLRALHREASSVLGRFAGRHQEHVRQAWHPRGGEAAVGVGCGRPVRVRGGLPPDS